MTFLCLSVRELRGEAWETLASVSWDHSVADALAIVLVGADILGRMGIVATGLCPFNGIDAAGIFAGTPCLQTSPSASACT